MFEHIDRSFSIEGKNLVCTLKIDKKEFKSFVEISSDAEKDDLLGTWWKEYLRGQKTRFQGSPISTLKVADLFCGAGGLANGLENLLREVHTSVEFSLIADQDNDALTVYCNNHDVQATINDSVTAIVDYKIRRWDQSAEFTYSPEILVECVYEKIRNIDLVMAGPPCQGHSNLNNRTRRNDDRNDLFLTVPAIAIAIDAKCVLIENVPSVQHDRGQVVQTSVSLLKNAGYNVECGILCAEKLGWPQSRKRFFLVASRGFFPVPLNEIQMDLRSKKRSVVWGISEPNNEYATHSPEDMFMYRVSELSKDNQMRIESLFSDGYDDLPLDKRPKSHKFGTTYKSVYGRMRRDEPSPTITTGFMTPGRGRFVHPLKKRTLNPREAARLQGFPDSYLFTIAGSRPPTRTKLAKWIGDAVPMPLGYAASLSLVSGLL